VTHLHLVQHREDPDDLWGVAKSLPLHRIDTGLTRDGERFPKTLSSAMEFEYGRGWLAKQAYQRAVETYTDRPAAGPGPRRWQETEPDYDVLRFLRLFMTGTHEIRVIHREGAVVSGRFNVPEILAAYARRYDGRGNVYVTLNPTKYGPTHYVRPGRATREGGIKSIEWLGIDYDHESPLPLELWRLLADHGFGEPLVAYSGRRWWLLYRIRQENTAETKSLRKRFLLGLHQRFPAVDPATYTASHVVRLFGTLNLKDPPLRSGLAHVPESMDVVGDEYLASLAVQEQKPRTNHPKVGRRTGGDGEDRLGLVAITVRHAEQGRRDKVLAREAWYVSRLVADGHLVEDDYFETITAAGVDAGLPEWRVRYVLRRALLKRQGRLL
jgi:hypothetical protein